MAKKLEFDVDKMEAFQKEVKAAREDLAGLKDDVSDYINVLKNEWKTEAGRLFFKEKLPNWEENVNKYLSVLDVLDRMMSTAVKEYSNIEEKAGGSAISCK